MNHRHSNVWVFYLFYGLLGFQFFHNEVMALYFLHFGLTYFHIGLLAVAGLMCTTLFEIPTGAFADLCGRRTSMLVGTFIVFSSFVFLSFGVGFPAFLIASLLGGIGAAFVSGASNALLYDSLKSSGQEDSYFKILSRTQAIFLAVGLLAAYGGPILFSINVRYPYYISTAASVLLVGVVLFFVEKRSIRSSNTLRLHFSQIAKSFRYSMNHHHIPWLIVFSSLLSVTVAIVSIMIASPYIISLGYSLSDLGFIMFVATALQTILVILSEHIEKFLGDGYSMIFVTFLMGMNLLFIGINTSFLLSLSFGLFWFSQTFKELIIEKYLNHHLQKKQRATILSIHNMVIAIVGAIAIPLVGLLLDHTSLQFVIIALGMSVLGIGSVILFVGWKRRVFALSLSTKSINR